jgi:hypothetical protein
MKKILLLLLLPAYSVLGGQSSGTKADEVMKHVRMGAIP